MVKRHGGLTVKDVAARISPTPDDVPSVIAQIRHWTREGLLKPTDRLRTGTGRWRRYSEESVYFAAVIHSLTQIGWTTGPLQDAMVMLRLQITTTRNTDGDSPWDDAIVGRRRVLALFGLYARQYSSDGTCVLDPDDASIPEDWRVGSWIDLTETFRRVQK